MYVSSSSIAVSVHDKDGSDDDSDEEDEEKEGEEREPMFTVSRDSRCASGPVHSQEVMFTDPLTWKGGCVGSGDLGSLPGMQAHYISLVPRPRPAFHRLQYGKAGRAWCVSSWVSLITNFTQYATRSVQTQRKSTFYAVESVQGQLLSPACSSGAISTTQVQCGCSSTVYHAYMQHALL